MKDYKCSEGKEIEVAVEILIDYCKRNNLENPLIDVTLNVGNGESIYQLKFERIDKDILKECSNAI